MSRIQLADIFQNTMVLQREKPIYIWGCASTGMKLTAQLGEQTVQTVVEEEKFEFEFAPMKADRGLTLTITVDGEETPELMLSDISIGDVYLAAGQSNMEYFLRYEAHFEELRKEEVNPDIHMYNVPQIAYEGQKRNLKESGYWFTKEDPAWRTFSAIGYLFASYLREEIDVPIGVIGCNWGGTPAVSWMSEKYVSKAPLTIFKEEYEKEVAQKTEEELKRESEIGWANENSYRHQLEWRTMMYGLTLEEQEEWMREHDGETGIPMGPYHQWRPFGLYETMIKKVAPYALKGVLWYQGESDCGHGEMYDLTFQAMTDCWRDTWKDAELPFYTVQIAPFGKWLGCDGESFPTLRESQQRAADTIKNVYMASIMDIGMFEDIHPKEKREIARRLALLALQHEYQMPIDAEAPEFLQAVRKGKQIICYFKHTGEGLWLKGYNVNALEIFQNETKVNIKELSIQKDRLILECEQLSEEEIQLSFAWSGYCEVNLYNSEDLSAKPFRAVIPAVK